MDPCTGISLILGIQTFIYAGYHVKLLSNFIVFSISSETCSEVFFVVVIITAKLDVLLMATGLQMSAATF